MPRLGDIAIESHRHRHRERAAQTAGRSDRAPRVARRGLNCPSGACSADRIRNVTRNGGEAVEAAGPRGDPLRFARFETKRPERRAGRRWSSLRLKTQVAAARRSGCGTHLGMVVRRCELRAPWAGSAPCPSRRAGVAEVRVAAAGARRGCDCSGAFPRPRSNHPRANEIACAPEAARAFCGVVRPPVGLSPPFSPWLTRTQLRGEREEGEERRVEGQGRAARPIVGAPPAT